MTFRRLAVLVSGFTLAVAISPALGKSYHAERFDVQVQLERDGSALVTETIVFRFTDGEFTRVFREVPTANTDGVDVLRALVDGRDVTRDVRIDPRSSRVRVTWLLPPTSGRAHEFVVTYRLRGVVTRANGLDAFAWRALPYEHDYRILASRVTVQLPSGATLTAPPRVSSPGGENRRRVEVTALAQADRAEFTAADIGRNGTYTVRMSTAAGELASAMPLWQRRDLERRAQAPVAATIAGVAGFLALTLLVVMWRNVPRPDAAVPRHVSRQVDPPDTLPPALAGALKKGGRADAGLGLATLFDLARRGIVRIEEQAKESRWTPRTFMVVRHDTPARLHPHEREVIALAFPESAVNSTKLSDVATRLNLKGGGFRRAVVSEIREARWLDDDRIAARGRLLKISGAILAVAAITVLGAVVTLDVWGPWGFLVPIALALVSVVGFVMGASVSVLSDEGLRHALRWTGFGRELKALARGHSGPSGDVLAHWFAYAVALGVGAAWAKRLDAEGLTRGVEWLRAVPAADGSHHGAFTAMMSGSGGAGAVGAGAGGAGGGAAGGGSSGAS
jgi:hypothetical protein